MALSPLGKVGDWRAFSWRFFVPLYGVLRELPRTWWLWGAKAKARGPRFLSGTRAAGILALNPAPEVHMDSRIALTVVALTAACGGPSPSEAPRAAPEGGTEVASVPGTASGEHVWTTADGVELPYAVAGAGDVTVVLVHCWMCDRTFWSEQIGPLAERYRTVSLDLPGHGEAGSGRAEWSVGGYGEDVAGLLRDLDLSDVVLVGHSMGGPVSLKAAALAPGRVRGIVAVDTLHDAEFDFSSEAVRGFVEAFEADFTGSCGSFVEEMFVEEGVEEIAARVRRASCAPERSAVGSALMRDYSTIDMPAWLAGAQVPIRAINAAAPHPTQVESNRKHADFEAVLVDGVGHYLHMTRPAEFNPLLLDAIAGILASTAEDA